MDTMNWHRTENTGKINMKGNEEWRESKWEKLTNNEVTKGRVASSQKISNPKLTQNLLK